MENDYRIENGVAIWNNNNAVIPVDVVEEYGFPVNLETQRKAREKKLEEFIQEYRKNPPKIDDVQMAEMRSVHGDGSIVVDVISGRKIKL